MPETVKRPYTAQSKSQPVTKGKKDSTGGGAKFPKTPACSDGKYEGTAAGKTKLNKF